MKKIIGILSIILMCSIAALSCGKSLPAPKPVDPPVVNPDDEKDDPTSISILAIGNSFSVDAMQYLYGFLKEAGYEKIYLGNLYIGGCSLKTHEGHFAKDDKAYTYYVNESGTWTSTASYSPLTALTSREWDYVSMQQASNDSGLPDTYEPYLGTIASMVKTKCPKAKLLWHMTWAYQANSSHSAFPNYDKDQMKMYKAIVNAVQTKVVPTKLYEHIIPCGTAVQNLRTSFIGDNITRDGYHMSYNIGRMTTAMMWARQIVGLDLSKSSYRPADQTLTDKQVEAIKDAVEKAYAKPFEVTESAFPGSPDDGGSDVIPGYEYPAYKPNTALRQMVIDAGYDLTDYKELEYKLLTYSFYNSSKSSIPESKHTGSTATNIDQFACIGIYEKKELPVGTIIACKGRGYRPEGWVNLNTNNSTRPGNVTDQIVVVDNGWWGSYNYRAFNLYWEGNIHMSEAQMNSISDGFAIFVPTKEMVITEPKNTDEVLAKEGYEPGKYTKMNISLTQYAYYNSSNATMKSTLICKDNSTASNLNQFAATPIYGKSDLPDGTLIVIMSGWQYRPEGWTALDTSNASSARPANTTKAITVVDQSWWGSWNYRAFNVAKTGNPALSDTEMNELKDKFAIYLPK